MKSGEIQSEAVSSDASLNLQKVWSDRLIGSTAREYAELLAVISNDELPAMASETIRDLMEWPMEQNEGNKERFVHFGAKGGSTAFILNDAMYVEDHEGNTFELVILMDELNRWQQRMMKNSLNSFESQILGIELYRQEVAEELMP